MYFSTITHQHVSQNRSQEKHQHVSQNRSQEKHQHMSHIRTLSTLIFHLSHSKAYQEEELMANHHSSPITRFVYMRFQKNYII
jgi:hypothetical protein